MPDLIVENIEKQLGTAQFCAAYPSATRARNPRSPGRLGKWQDDAAALGRRL